MNRLIECCKNTGKSIIYQKNNSISILLWIKNTWIMRIKLKYSKKTKKWKNNIWNLL